MSTSNSHVNLHIFLLLILLIIFGNHAKVSARGIDRRPLILDDDQPSILPGGDYLPYKSLLDETLAENRWPRTYGSAYLLATPDLNSRRGILRLVPYKKRTIPLDLQKALYAHGIVGR